MKLVAVLGYSTRRGNGLHPVCAERIAVAERAARDADLVLLSGWSRRPQQPSEAELMRDAWRGPDLPLIVDGDARSTIGNVRAVAAAARDVRATEVVLVTSAWHARRVRLLARAALGHDIAVEIETSPPARPLRLVARELACLPPALARRALARRR